MGDETDSRRRHESLGARDRERGGPGDKPRLKLLVAVPLCDYEPATAKVWYRRTTHLIVKQCLESFSTGVRTPLDMYILADRCSDEFVDMAQKSLKRFNPVLLDNSTVRQDLQGIGLPEKSQHLLNQLLKAFELAEHHDLVYFCEQDYLFKKDALLHAVTAFEEIPELGILTMFDHPSYHDPKKQTDPHRHFQTSLSEWKSVSFANGNLVWRVAVAQKEYGLIRFLVRQGGLDLGITRGLHRRGILILAPIRSLIQHYRLDGSKRSPTFGHSWRVSLFAPVGQTIRTAQRVRNFVSRIIRMFVDASA